MQVYATFKDIFNGFVIEAFIFQCPTTSIIKPWFAYLFRHAKDTFTRIVSLFGMGLCLKDPFNEFCCIISNVFCPSNISLRIPLLDIAVSRCQVFFIGGVPIAFSVTNMDGYSLVIGVDLHLVRIVMDLYPLAYKLVWCAVIVFVFSKIDMTVFFAQQPVFA